MTSPRTDTVEPAQSGLSVSFESFRSVDLKKHFLESLEVKGRFLSELANIEQAAELIANAFRQGRKLLICGNGGSAADAQHIAAELVGRFQLERRGLPAIALTTDSSVMTAWGNDYSFETVFSRQVEALGNPGDVLLAISTSGNSKNILAAVEKAKHQQMKVIGMTGAGGGRLKGLSDRLISAPSDVTARIQECHLVAYHLICEYLDHAFAH